MAERLAPLVFGAAEVFAWVAAAGVFAGAGLIAMFGVAELFAGGVDDFATAVDFPLLERYFFLGGVFAAAFAFGFEAFDLDAAGFLMVDFASGEELTGETAAARAAAAVAIAMI